MLNQQTDSNFWNQWVFVNSASFLIGLISFQSFFITPLVPGLAQWLILKKQICGLSRWWIFTNVIGIIVYELMGGKLAFNSSFSDFCFVYTNSSTICAVFSYSIGGAFGGFVTGVQQWLLLKRHISLYNLRTSWILASTLGWTLGGAIGSAALFKTMFTIAFVVGVFAFGFLFGMLNGAITGVFLIKIRKYYNRSVI